jgi:uncharacterized protein (DUF433 family)
MVSPSGVGRGIALRIERLEDMEMKRLVQSSADIMMGKPVIAGTRITVELILEKLAAGEPEDQIVKAHPRLTHEAIQAALAFAAEALKADVVYPDPAEAFA